MEFLHGFSLTDLAAFLALILAWIGYELYSVRASQRGTNSSALMRSWRTKWMRTAISRDNRIVDLQIIRVLMGNSAFLASTAIFVVAGIAAVIGSAGEVVQILNGYEFLAETTRNRFGLKLTLLGLIFINAFFRLAWSMRLHSNAAVVLGTIQQPENIKDREAAETEAEIAADLCTLAAKHYQGGMHAYYFGLAACAWFIHPVALIASVFWVVAILYRREFRSNSQAALQRGL